MGIFGQGSSRNLIMTRFVRALSGNSLREPEIVATETAIEIHDVTS